MDPLMSKSAVVELANIGILITLLIIYIRVYKNSKATFTLGLIFFVCLLMLRSIIAMYAYFEMEQLYIMALLQYFAGYILFGLGPLE